MIYVFDLDDTLYEELTFVKSGYRSVSQYLAKYHSLNADLLYQEMISLLLISRDRVFDKILKKNNLYSRILVYKCLSVYRHHQPKLHLYPDVEKLLLSIGKPSLYCVTDGNKLVQSNKVRALNLEKYFSKIYLTSNYGLKHAKPSPYCFLKICDYAQVAPEQVYCIGDNPNKDFVSLKPLGFRTVRILRGGYKDSVYKHHYEADVTIKEYGQILGLNL